MADFFRARQTSHLHSEGDVDWLRTSSRVTIRIQYGGGREKETVQCHLEITFRQRKVSGRVIGWFSMIIKKMDIHLQKYRPKILPRTL